MTPQEIEKRRRALANLGMSEEEADAAVATLSGSRARPALRSVRTGYRFEVERPEDFRPRIALARAILAGLDSPVKEQAHALKEQVAVVGDDELDVQFTPSSKPRKLKVHPKVADLIAHLRAAPVPEGESPPSETELQERAMAIIKLLGQLGVELCRQGKPVLLLSAFRGGNELARMMASLAAEIPTLQRTALDRRVKLASDFLGAFRGRIL